jgi:putative hemolysin
MEARYCKHCGGKLKPSDTDRCMACFMKDGGKCVYIKSDVY